MNRIIRAAILGLSLAAPLCGMAATQDPVAAADVIPGVWQHHKMTINYFGITASFTCYALEDHVRNILVHLGARKDAKVNANGCPGGPDLPSRNAWIETDFYTLAPADSSSTTDIVKAHWAAREVSPHRPFFLGDGDCELIEQMKDLISKSFSLRDVEYRTDCIPHEITVDGFAIKGQALVAVDGAKG